MNREERAEREAYMDSAEGLARVRGNLKIYRALLAVLLEDTHFERLKDEMLRGDYEAAAQTVHALKGVAANLSLTQLYACSRSLEAHLKAQDDVAKVFADYEEVFGKTLRYVVAFLEEDAQNGA